MKPVIKTFQSIHDKIDFIKNVEVDLMKKKDRYKTIRSCFNTINNRNRYKYLWQSDTETLHKLLLFYVLLDKIITKQNAFDLLSDAEAFSNYVIYDILKFSQRSDQRFAKLSLYMAMRIYNEKLNEILERFCFIKVDLIDLLATIDWKDQQYFTKNLTREAKEYLVGIMGENGITNQAEEGARVINNLGKSKKKKKKKDYLAYI